MFPLVWFHIEVSNCHILARRFIFIVGFIFASDSCFRVIHSCLIVHTWKSIIPLYHGHFQKNKYE